MSNEDQVSNWFSVNSSLRVYD
jgi:serine/threonine-protein phosphatase 2A regulatory subunit B''